MAPLRNRLATAVPGWSVPLILLAAIATTLLRHWPMYLSLIAGWVWSSLYAALNKSDMKSILSASWHGMRQMWRVCLVLLLVGAVVALWMKAGVIPEVMSVASQFISSRNLPWISFLLSALLSMLIGSSIATWSVLGPPLIGLAPLHFVGLTAGALISGAMVGDRGSPMSTSVIIMSKASGVDYSSTLRRLNVTSVLPFLLSGIGFFIVSITVLPHVSDFHRAGVSPGPSSVAHSILLLIPPLVVILLALLRVPLIYNLVTALFIALAYAIALHTGGFVNILGTMWHGAAVPPLTGSASVSHPSAASTSHGHTISGVHAMLSAVYLIASAGAFQGVTKLGKSVDVLTKKLLSRIRGTGSFLIASYAFCVVFAMLMGSQMLSVLMSGESLAPSFADRGVPSTRLLDVVSDSAELTPALIPWNLLGLQASIILAVPTAHFLGYAWFIYLSVLWSIIRGLVGEGVITGRRLAKAIPDADQSPRLHR